MCSDINMNEILSPEDIKSYVFYNVFGSENVFVPEIDSTIMNMKIFSQETALKEKKMYIELYLRMVPFYFGLYKKCCMDHIYRLFLSNGECVSLEFKKKYCMHLIGLDYHRIKEILCNYSEELKLDANQISEMSSDKIMEFVFTGDNIDIIVNYCNSKTDAANDFINSFFSCISEYGFKKLYVIRYLSEKSLTDFSKCFVVEKPNDFKKSDYAVIYNYRELGKEVVNGFERIKISCIAFCVGSSVTTSGRKNMYLSSSRFFQYKDELEDFISNCDISFVKGCRYFNNGEFKNFDIVPDDSIKMIQKAFPEKTISAGPYLVQLSNSLKKYGANLLIITDILKTICSGERNINGHDILAIKQYNELIERIIKQRILLEGSEVECNYLTVENYRLRDEIARLYDLTRNLKAELKSTLGEICDLKSNLEFLNTQNSGNERNISILKGYLNFGTLTEADVIYRTLSFDLMRNHSVSIEKEEFEELAFYNLNYSEICEYIKTGRCEYKEYYDKFIEDIVSYKEEKNKSELKGSVTYISRNYKKFRISPKIREFVFPSVLVNSSNRRIKNSSISMHSIEEVRSALAFINRKYYDVLLKKFTLPNKRGMDKSNGITSNDVTNAITPLKTYFGYYDTMDYEKFFDIVNDVFSFEDKKNERAKLILQLRYGLYNSNKWTVHEINGFLMQHNYKPTTPEEMAMLFNIVFKKYRELVKYKRKNKTIGN